MTILESVVSIVRDASLIMLKDSYDISLKGGFSNIVTSSDLAVQEYLCARLSELIPGSGFLCEEEDMQDNAHEYTWVIDPIDGTANYSRGLLMCAICVGLRHFTEMEMGVVYLPRNEKMFYAEKGKGAFMNMKPIHVSNRPFEDGIMCAALSLYHKENAEVCSRIISSAFLQCNDIRRFGAAAPELCCVAMGRFELFFEYILQAWDFAAASVILTEAGGFVSDLDGNPLDFTRPSGVLAANTEESLRRLVRIVKSQC